MTNDRTNDSSTKSLLIDDRSKLDCDWRFLFVLWLVPLCAYLWLIGRWSLSGDEFYTLVDSSKPVLELLSYERKPLYYLLCHVLLQFDFGLPVETVIRLPAAIAASLIPPTFYILLSTKLYGNVRVLAAILALFNPWLFQMSQFARFYSLAFLFASIAALAGLRCVHSKSKKRWLFLFFVAGGLATISQIPAGLVMPAGLVGLAVALFRKNPVYVSSFAKRYGAIVAVVGLVCMLAGFVFLKDLFLFWLSQKGGKFGNASAIDILIGMALGGGLSSWALAFVPLVRSPLSWSSDDLYLAITVALSGFPLLILVPFGGGVASSYLMFCLPCLFVLAASHWRQVDERLPRWGYRIAVAMGLLAFNLPYLASGASNGDHFDYRETAMRIDAMQFDSDPVIVSSAHQLLNMYMQNAESEIDLATFEGGIKRHIVQEGIDLAEQEGRPLLLVSREDRTRLSAEDQAWLYSRFALISTISRARYDHRRHRMAIYEYRPATGVEACADDAKQELKVDGKAEVNTEREPALAIP